MSFTTPTVDVYVPGTTLGIGNVNAGTINIGKAGTTINVGGSMAITNSVTTPSCTMTSMNVSSLIIAPFSGDVAFNNFSALNATIGNASIINASFNSINSSNILIGPYPVSGAFTNMNVTNATITTVAISNLSSTNINVLNASMTYVNVSGLLINPLPTNPTFTSINTGTGTSTITIGNNTNSVALNGPVTLAKPLTLGTAPTSNTQLGYFARSTTVVVSTGISSGMSLFTAILPVAGSYAVTFYIEVFSSGTGNLVGGYLSTAFGGVGFSNVYGANSEYYSCTFTIFTSLLSIPVAFSYRSGTITSMSYYYSYIKIA